MTNCLRAEVAEMNELRDANAALMQERDDARYRIRSKGSCRIEHTRAFDTTVSHRHIDHTLLDLVVLFLFCCDSALVIDLL